MTWSICLCHRSRQAGPGTRWPAGRFPALSGLELQGVIEHQWEQLGLDTALQENIDAAVINAIARVTGGNFRLVQRLFAQIERIVTINELPTLTTDVVTLARERLVDGPA